MKLYNKGRNIILTENQKTIRKFVATAATATLAASAFAPVAFAQDQDVAEGFTDVPADYQEAVDFVVQKGMQGLTENAFGTNEEIKRVDAAVFFANVLELDTEHAPDSGFTDVPARARGAVNALKAAGITTGESTTSFDSYSPITLGEIAIWIQKSFQLTGEADASYTDVPEQYAEAVDALVANNIYTGISETEFGIAENTKRGDLAVLLHKAYVVTAPDFELSIMHTNDTHAHVEKIAKRATAINAYRSEHPDALLLDAGDVFSGTLYFNEYKGQASLEFMNYLGYDAMTFGNHEFDLGASPEGHQALADFIKKAKFPFVSSNVDFSKDSLFKGLYHDDFTDQAKAGNIYNGIIKEVDGEKVGIFGLTTEETPTISSTKEVTFSNYVKEAKKAVAYFEEQGINKIIAITHLGYDDSLVFDNDLELAKEVDGIDVIVGGHTHTELAEPTVITEGKDEPTIIVQTGEYSNNLGTLDVDFDENGKVIGQASELVDISGQAEDPTVLKMLKPYSDKIAALQNESIQVEASVVLDGERANVRTKETNLGNLISDSLLAKGKEINPEATIAFANGGGIRASIDVGDITLGEILTVMPFGNTLGILNLKGSEIKTALEHSVSEAPEASGGFLQVAGMKFTYDSSKPKGERVLTIDVKNADGTFAPIDNDKSYYVVTNTFTAKGGDGYDVFKKAYEEGRVSEPGYVDYEIFKDYLQKNKTVTPVIENRIVDVAK